MRDFLERATAPGPFRFIASRRDLTKKPWHQAARDIDEMLRAVALVDATSCVWFTPASFNVDFYQEPDPKVPGGLRRRTGRHVKHAVAVKSFWLDADIKPDLSHYHDEKTLLAALAVLLQQANLPRPTGIVHTGNGLHIWWMLFEAIPLVRWQVLAAKLKNCVVKHKFLCDAGLTADAARIMRVPGTWNRKDPANPKPVQLTWTGDLIDVAVLETALAGYDGTVERRSPSSNDRAAEFLKNIPAGTLKAAQALYEPGINADIGAQIDGREPADMGQITRRCRMMAHVVSTAGADLTEEEWKNTLQLSAYCENPETWAHAVSSGHSGYDASATDRKMDERILAKTQGIGPITCRTFSSMPHLSEQCAKCDLRGLISTPLQFGRKSLSVPGSGFDRDAEGNVFHLVKAEDGSQQMQPVFPGYRFRRHELFEYKDPEEDLPKIDLTFDVEHNGVTSQRKLTAKSMSDLRSFKREASAFISGTDSTLGDLLGYKRSWVQKLREGVRHNYGLIGQMGWIERKGRRGFCTGDRTYWADGEIDVLDPMGSLGAYGARGSSEPWLEAARLIMSGPFELQTALAVAFGAPLAAILGQQGAAIALYGRTGSGKTSAIRTGAAVWGDPIMTIISMLDTKNATMKRLGLANNLPFYLDETNSAGDSSGFIELIFQVTSGRGKSRLTSASELMMIDVYRTLIMIGTNDQMRETVAGMAQMPEAAMARIHQINLPDVSRIDGYKYEATFSALQKNYGHWGRIYIQHILKNYDRVHDFVHSVHQTIGKLVPDPEGNLRFIIASAAQMHAGYVLMGEVTGLPVNPVGFGNYMQKSIMDLSSPTSMTVRRAMPGASTIDAALRAISSYMNQHRENILVTQSVRFGQAAQPQPLTNIQEPMRQKITGHRSLDDHLVWLAISDLKDWAGKVKLPTTSILSNVERHSSFVRYERVALGFDVNRVQPYVADCIVLDTDKLV